MLRTRPTPTLFFSCRSRARKDRLRILGMPAPPEMEAGQRPKGADSQVRSLGRKHRRKRMLIIYTHARAYFGWLLRA